jgi:hypothetical protein
MKRVLLVHLLLCATALMGQSVIPQGTILPLKLNSSLNSNKSQAGQRIAASLAQDVLLPNGYRIRVGSKVAGHIVAVTRAGAAAGARLAFQFDTMQATGRMIPFATDLRALASMMEVHEAQLPEAGPDRGTPPTAWVTEQIGGETNYHGGWPITHGSEVVGKSLLSGGVLVRVSAKPGSACRGEIDDNDQPQALWVFASDACGTYGFADLTIAHAGRTEPVGQIVLTSAKQDINVRAGSGLLLRVIGSH